jgi:hypothetical protein
MTVGGDHSNKVIVGISFVFIYIYDFLNNLEPLAQAIFVTLSYLVNLSYMNVNASSTRQMAQIRECDSEIQFEFSRCQRLS